MLSASDKIDTEIESPRLKIILSDLPQLLEDVDKFISNIDPNAARLVVYAYYCIYCPKYFNFMSLVCN